MLFFDEFIVFRPFSDRFQGVQNLVQAHVLGFCRTRTDQVHRKLSLFFSVSKRSAIMAPLTEGGKSVTRQTNASCSVQEHEQIPRLFCTYAAECA